MKSLYVRLFVLNMSLFSGIYGMNHVPKNVTIKAWTDLSDIALNPEDVIIKNAIDDFDLTYNFNHGDFKQCKERKELIEQKKAPQNSDSETYYVESDSWKQTGKKDIKNRVITLIPEADKDAWIQNIVIIRPQIVLGGGFVYYTSRETRMHTAIKIASAIGLGGGLLALLHKK